MTVIILKENELNTWDEFVNHSSNSSFFNTSGWLKTIKSVYGFPYYCIVKKKNGEIISGIPVFETRSLIFGRKLVSNPFSLYSSVMYTSGHVCKELIEFIIDFANKKNIKKVEMRLYNKIPVSTPLKETNIRIIPLLRLKDTYENTFNNYKKQFRTNLKRLNKEIENNKDFAVHTGVDIKDYTGFYEVLSTLYKNKHFMFPAPLDFFLYLRNNKVNHKLYLVRFKDNIVAGIIIYLFKKRAYYAWSAADRDFDKYSVSTYLLNHIIKSLHKAGIKEFDMGVTSPGNNDLLFYKTRWGSEITRPYLYYSGAEFNDMGAETSFMNIRKFIRYIPVSFFKKITNSLYRQLT